MSIEFEVGVILTPTMKLKRKQARDFFVEEIKRIYKSADAAMEMAAQKKGDSESHSPTRTGAGGMFGQFTSFDPKAALKAQIPDDYKGMVDNVEAGLEMANELKKQKDAAQLLMIKQTLKPILSSLGLSETGILKEQCQTMTLTALEKINKQQYFIQGVFDKLFEQVDPDEQGSISVDQLAHLINMLVF